jgi:IS605 OrfB family transposase
MLIIPQAKIESDLSFYIPMTPAFKKQYGRIKLRLPDRLRGKNIKEIRILPKYNARFFEIEYVYEVEVEPQNVAPDRALAIDPGLDNLVTCIDTNGSSFIVDGKYLKSINRWYNKEKATRQSILDRQKLGHFSNRQARITQKRSNRIRDYFNKTARMIINYCIAQGIGTVIFGYNPDQKQEINLGRRNNQNFVQIPHSQLRQKIKGLCERYGLKYQEQEESYTSQASFIDADAIPVYGQVKNPSFSGKRIKRGLYKTKQGILVNSDVNGAANILRKSSHRLDFQRVGRGLLNNPLRVNLVRIPALKR